MSVLRQDAFIQPSVTVKLQRWLRSHSCGRVGPVCAPSRIPPAADSRRPTTAAHLRHMLYVSPDP